MAWGEEGVTKLLYKQDSVNSWGTLNTPKNIQILKQGIIRQLRMIQSGALSFAGATTASKMGPYNAYTLLELLGNSQQDIFRVSGYGMYLINCVLAGLEKKHGPPNSAGNGPVNPTDTDYVYDGSATAAPASNPNWNWFLNMPVAQRIRALGGDIGMIPMSTENSQLQFSFTATAAAQPSPGVYTINSATDDLSAPYFGANAVTLTAPTLDLFRIMYEAVLNPQDMPDFNWVSQWLEETPQTYSGNAFTWKQNQDAGVLMRLIWGVWSNASPWGLLTANLPAPNAFQLSYNSDTAKFKESGVEALARQREQLGFDMPQGTFFYDMLGEDLTLADVLNSYIVPAIQLNASYTAITLNANVNPKVIAQRLLPIRVA